jgi:hypothetical protein
MQVLLINQKCLDELRLENMLIAYIALPAAARSYSLEQQSASSFGNLSVSLSSQVTLL